MNTQYQISEQQSRNSHRDCGSKTRRSDRRKRAGRDEMTTRSRVALTIIHPIPLIL